MTPTISSSDPRDLSPFPPMSGSESTAKKVASHMSSLLPAFATGIPSSSQIRGRPTTRTVYKSKRSAPPSNVSYSTSHSLSSVPISTPMIPISGLTSSLISSSSLTSTPSTNSLSSFFISSTSSSTAPLPSLLISGFPTSDTSSQASVSTSGLTLSSISSSPIPITSLTPTICQSSLPSFSPISSASDSSSTPGLTSLLISSTSSSSSTSFLSSSTSETSLDEEEEDMALLAEGINLLTDSIKKLPPTQARDYSSRSVNIFDNHFEEE